VTYTPQQLIAMLPELFLPEVAGRTKALVHIDLTGTDGGQWWVAIADGQCVVGDGTPDARPDVTMAAAASDYVKIRLGQLDPVAATMRGQLKITGKFGTAVKFAKMFRKIE
jgi:putative sterol carrier protein